MTEKFIKFMEKKQQYLFGDFEIFEGEEVKMIIRKHWFVEIIILKSYLFWGIFLPCAVCLGMMIIGEIALFSSVLLTTIAISFFYSGSLLLFFFTRWLNEMYDVIVITTDRVVDITQIDLFHRDIIETRLANVQDATGVVNGFWNTLFDWGELRIRTANDTSDFHIDCIRKPHMQARLIFNFANEARKNQKKEVEKNEKNLPEEEKKYERKRMMPLLHTQLQKLGILKH